ncbi:MAG: nucleotidyltransferase [Epsilonproteobacteria bacterium]|nr:nucleotidyltransferase [Campylobacterota bacterium]NPA64806.1 nucleotidyltransferase [Campylobacterota bacterium]
MKKSDVLLKLSYYKAALTRLEEAVEEAIDELDKDGVLQRFEFTFELLWKSLKAILAYEGIECYSPKSCIKEAFKANLIPEDEIFLDMLEDRNLSSHIYDKNKSEEIFERIKKVYLPFLQKLKLQVG